VIISLLIGNCSSSGDFTGYSYDPEGVTDTKNKEIQNQHKRVIGVDKQSIWISNEFKGARMNDFYQVNDSLYRVVIEPENHPINESPWYAFKIWSNSSKDINLQLTYKHADHRYIPKLSTDGTHWEPIDSTNYQPDTLNGTATLSLDLDKDTLWISAQEQLTYEDFRDWADSLAAKSSVTLDTVGYSHDQRPIIKMNITEADTSKNRGVMIITGRLHPPEVTGGLAAKVFINELTSDSKLATDFRREFEIWAYPFVNPDGVQRGHWRHNAKGIDLNRDWKNFNQPEPRAIRDDLLPLKDDSLSKVFYGIDFHSTDENIFYPINRDIETFPEDFTYKWIDSLKQKFPDYSIEVEPFPPNSPITKNWIFHTFGADAVTYEINDEVNRDSMRMVTRESAHIIMRQLLDEKEQ
jgi:predicted deacylase